MKSTKYSLSVRIMHWLIAIIVISMLISGLYMTSLPNDNQIKFSIYTVHKAVGITVLALIVLRIILRLFSYAPPLPKNFSQVTIFLTKAVHFTLYILMMLIPLSGYVMSSASGRNIKYLFNFNIPLLVSENKLTADLAHQLHSILAYLLIAFIALHLLGTIKHLIIDKQNILKRII